MANVMYPVIVDFDYNWMLMIPFGSEGPYYWDEGSRRWDSNRTDEFSVGYIFWTEYLGITGAGDGEAIGTIIGSGQNLPPTESSWRLIVTSTVLNPYLTASEVTAFQDVTPGVDVPFNLPIAVGQVLALAEYDSGTDTYVITNAYGPYRFIVAVEPDGQYKFSRRGLVYELDKGWSFDGEYIPHFLELNWFFGENPFVLDTIQKIRIHGLVKGVVNLQVAMSGMQGDVATDYIADYMEPQFIDFPFAPIHVSSEFLPATNYVDVSDRGLALLMKFEGRNTDISLPEPAHVIQVLALQSSPQGNGKTAN